MPPPLRKKASWWSVRSAERAAGAHEAFSEISSAGVSTLRTRFSAMLSSDERSRFSPARGAGGVSVMLPEKLEKWRLTTPPAPTSTRTPGGTATSTLLMETVLIDDISRGLERWSVLQGLARLLRPRKAPRETRPGCEA